MRWARFFPILSEAALILIYAPWAAYGSTDMRRLCPGRIFLYLSLIFITFASQHGGRRSTLVVLASIAQRFCAPTTIPRSTPPRGIKCSQPGCHTQLAGAKEAVPWVPQLSTLSPVGASKERYLDYVCPHRGCDPLGFLYGFEARI